MVLCCLMYTIVVLFCGVLKGSMRVRKVGRNCRDGFHSLDSLVCGLGFFSVGSDWFCLGFFFLFYSHQLYKI